MKRRRITAIVIAIVFPILIAGQSVFAEDIGECEQQESVRIIREGTENTEELIGIRISDDRADEWLNEESGVAIQSVGASAEQNSFLESGSSYGYQDMEKRSSTAGRQYMYRQMDAKCREFTLNQSNASADSIQGYPICKVATISLAGYPLSDEEKIQVYFTFRNDKPQYFWLSNMVVWSSNSVTLLTYDAYQSGTARMNAFKEILQTQKEVYMSQISDADSTYKKVLKIHDALIADIEYSYADYSEISHSIAGAMTSARSAVCEGYSKVMQLMMNRCGIENIYVTGEAGGAHAWNMVRMDDGKYYWLDATWDDQIDEIFQHQYFLVGSNDFGDHTADVPGTGEIFLYELPAVSNEAYVSNEVFLQAIHIEETLTLSRGESRELLVTYKPENATDDRTVVWSSSNPSSVSVDQNGVVRARKASSQAVITAQAGDKIAECLVTVNPLAEGERIKGDVNRDGDVDIEDLRIVLRYVCGKTELDAEKEEMADVAVDGKVDIQDLRKILRYVCGKIDEL